MPLEQQPILSTWRLPTSISDRTAIIIGAGPAGLTAAHELLTRAGIRPVVLERSNYMGGISRTTTTRTAPC
jgi:protoporphyrinogen oxidase